MLIINGLRNFYPVIHRSDYAMLSEGSVVISSSYRKIRNIVSYIGEHHFEVLKVKHADAGLKACTFL